MATRDSIFQRRTSTTPRIFKLLLIGESGVGKTCLRRRFTDDDFHSRFCSTVGFDFTTKTLIHNEEKITVQLWDTAGQERYRSMTSAYFRGADGFLLLYDVTDKASFQAVRFWGDQIKTCTWNSHKVVLVANKIDALPGLHMITTEMGSNLAQELGYDFFQTSAKTGDQVHSLFRFMIESIGAMVKEESATSSNASWIEPHAQAHVAFNGEVPRWRNERMEDKLSVSGARRRSRVSITCC